MQRPAFMERNGLIGRGWSFCRPDYIFDASESRRSRVAVRVRVRVRVMVGVRVGVRVRG